MSAPELRRETNAPQIAPGTRAETQPESAPATHLDALARAHLRFEWSAQLVALGKKPKSVPEPSWTSPSSALPSSPANSLTKISVTEGIAESKGNGVFVTKGAKIRARGEDGSDGRHCRSGSR